MLPGQGQAFREEGQKTSWMDTWTLSPGKWGTRSPSRPWAGPTGHVQAGGVCAPQGTSHQGEQHGPEVLCGRAVGLGKSRHLEGQLGLGHGGHYEMAAQGLFLLALAKAVWASGQQFSDNSFV